MKRAVLTGVAFALLGFTWAVALWNFGSLPAIVPTHFDGRGLPSGYGSKNAVLIAPAIATVTFAGLVLAERVDDRWYSYPFKIRADALVRAAEYTRVFVAACSVVAMGIFAVLEAALVNSSAQGRLNGLLALNWVVLGSFVLALAAYVVALVPYREKG